MIATISPDGNSVVAISSDGPDAAPRPVDRVGGWPFRFDRVYALYAGRWRAFRPDDLPAKFWR